MICLNRKKCKENERESPINLERMAQIWELKGDIYREGFKQFRRDRAYRKAREIYLELLTYRNYIDKEKREMIYSKLDRLEAILNYREKITRIA